MRALRYEAPGAASFADVAPPLLDGDRVVIRPAYTGLCGTDVLVVRGGHVRAVPPVVLGHEFSGTVVAAPEGADVCEGDEVTVEPLVTCGSCGACRGGRENCCPRLRILGIDQDGSLAELVAVPMGRVLRLPHDLDLRSAALTEPLAVACHLMGRVGPITQADRVYIAGAGPIGLLAAELALKRDAQVVVGEVNDARRAAAARVGAEVVDPAEGSASLRRKLGPDGATVCLEASGHGTAFDACLELAAVGARLGLVGLPKEATTVDTERIIAKEVAVLGSRVYTRPDVEEALRLLHGGTVDVDLHVSDVVRFEDAVTAGLDAIAAGGPARKILVEGPGEAR